MSIGKTASGQMLGYLYQIDRAILALSQMTTTDSFIEVETDDDVVQRLIDNNGDLRSIYEQDKSTVTTNNPFYDSSVNFWKTLAIWSNLILKDDINLDQSYFILCSSKSIPKNCLASKIQDASTQQAIKKVKKELKEMTKSLSGDSLDYALIFKKLKSEKMEKLLSRISVLGGDYDSGTLKIRDQVKSNFKQLENIKALEEVNFDEIFNYLQGWVIDKLKNKWLLGKRGVIRYEDFINVFWTELSKNIRKPLIEKIIDSIEIAEADIEDEKSKNGLFIKQLDLLNLPEKFKIQSIEDFLLAKQQKIEFANQDTITKEEYEKFQKTLNDHWLLTSSLTDESNDINTGKSILKDCLNYKARIGEYILEANSTVKGEYHNLSNNKFLGWHPNWEKLLKNE